MDILVVDGYNIIGAWPELKKLKEVELAKARDLLIEKMAEYQAHTGYKVFIVFDAHSVPGNEKKTKNYLVDIIYTRQNETADERIEKMAISLNNVNTQIHVATSDFVEQWAIFGHGALRKSARDLWAEMRQIEANISKSVTNKRWKTRSAKIPISNEVAKKFEKWRRGKG